MRAPGDDVVRVLAAIGGAQAQVESAAKMSLWARVRNLSLAEVDNLISGTRTIARAACMRRTLHLVPSAEIAMFVRGTAMRAQKEIRWMLNKGVPEAELSRVLDAVLDAFATPLTRRELVETVASALGMPPTRAADGWWGNTAELPSIQIGPIACPANYLLALVGARGVVCYGEPRGNEPTFVRADAWLPGVHDLDVRNAEEELLRRYLRAFGPATPADFVAWTRVRRSDADAVWKRLEPELCSVRVGDDSDGEVLSLLASDLDALSAAEFDRPNVRLLPYFDTCLLGHAGRDFVDARHYNAVYRPQGWISAVLLVNGNVCGTWTSEQKKKRLELTVTPFKAVPKNVARMIRQESDSLAAFLGCDEAELTILPPAPSNR